MLHIAANHEQGGGASSAQQPPVKAATATGARKRNTSTLDRAQPMVFNTSTTAQLDRGVCPRPACPCHIGCCVPPTCRTGLLCDGLCSNGWDPVWRHPRELLTDQGLHLRLTGHCGMFTCLQAERTTAVHATARETRGYVHGQSACSAAGAVRTQQAQWPLDGGVRGPVEPCI